jgi:hypothetical protein
MHSAAEKSYGMLLIGSEGEGRGEIRDIAGYKAAVIAPRK